MHRRPLLEVLERYEKVHPDEAPMVGRMRTLVAGRSDCFDRQCLPGHVTASCWILSHDRRRFLLTHHRKLDRWLQLGGHADGDGDALRVALREAREESGMQTFGLIDPHARDGAPPWAGQQAVEPSGAMPVPIDVDVHHIPARKSEPAHEHHDVRFMLVAAPGQPLVISDESSDLAWFPLAALGEVGADESLLRLGRKAAALRDAPAHPLGI